MNDIVCFRDQYSNAEKPWYLNFRHFCLKLVSWMVTASLPNLCQIFHKNLIETPVLVWHERSWVRAPNLPNACGHACRYVDWKGSAAISICHTRGESQEFIVYRWESRQASDPPWLRNQERRYQKSKTGVLVAPKKDSCPPKIKIKQSKDSYNPFLLVCAVWTSAGRYITRTFNRLRFRVNTEKDITNNNSLL